MLELRFWWQTDARRLAGATVELGAAWSPRGLKRVQDANRSRR